MPLAAIDTGSSEQGFRSWRIDGDQTIDGYSFELFVQFRDRGVPLTGTFDLTAGDQANYETCAVCLLGVTRTDIGIDEYFFQSAGTLTLDEDPLVTGRLRGTLFGVVLEEAVVANGTSLPVNGGQCVDLGNHALDHDGVPSAWTCDRAAYGAGTACDCECGAPDPDCAPNDSTAVACDDGEVCVDRTGGTCMLPPANDTCATAIPLPLTPTAAYTYAAIPDYDYATCQAIDPASDIVYRIDLTAGQTLHVTMTDIEPDYDRSVAVVGPGDPSVCDAAPIVCDGAAFPRGDGAIDLTYTADEDGRYYVVVDAYTSEGSFTITGSVL